MLRKLDTKVGTYTFEDFCFMVRDDQKADLIGGEIYMSSPDNTDAYRLFRWLGTVMHLYVKKKRLGEVFGSRVAFRLSESEGPEPDLAFVRRDRLHLVQRGRIDGAPDLAVEIVSPDSIERDYTRKRQQYQGAGVLEYWIIDELEHTDTLLRLGRDGEYKQVRPRKGALTLRTVPGFWLRLEWLWQDPMPDELEILEQLLAAGGGAN